MLLRRRLGEGGTMAASSCRNEGISRRVEFEMVDWLGQQSYLHPQPTSAAHRRTTMADDAT